MSHQEPGDALDQARRLEQIKFMVDKDLVPKRAVEMYAKCQAEMLARYVGMNDIENVRSPAVSAWARPPIRGMEERIGQGQAVQQWARSETRSGADQAPAQAAPQTETPAPAQGQVQGQTQAAPTPQQSAPSSRQTPAQNAATGRVAARSIRLR